MTQLHLSPPIVFFIFQLCVKVNAKYAVTPGEMPACFAACFIFVCESADAATITTNDEAKVAQVESCHLELRGKNTCIQCTVECSRRCIVHESARIRRVWREKGKKENISTWTLTITDSGST